MMNFVVTRFKDLLVLVTHLTNYPLQSQKHADYLLFREALNIILNKKHLKYDGLLQIVNLKASLNTGLSEMLIKSFPDHFPSLKPIITSSLILPLSRILGFINGDGSFGIRILKEPSYTSGYRVQLRLRITQHNRDKSLLESIINTLNCGAVTDYGKGEIAAVFTVTSIKDIGNKVIPFIENGLLLGGKHFLGKLYMI